MQHLYSVKNNRNLQDEVKVAVIADSMQAEQASYQQVQFQLLLLATAVSALSAYLLLG